MLREVLFYIVSRGLLYGSLAAIGLVLMDTLAEYASRHGWLPL